MKFLFLLAIAYMLIGCGTNSKSIEYCVEHGYKGVATTMQTYMQCSDGELVGEGGIKTSDGVWYKRHVSWKYYEVTEK
jgi:hypothetical protein